MPSVTYIANGFCKSATPEDKRRGDSELRIWNPMPWETTLRMRVYYADRPPADLPEIKIGPYANPLLVFPRQHPKVFTDVGPWGMRLVSDTILITDHILGGVGHEGPADNVKYQGGCNDSLAKSRLSTVWYFGDGIVLQWDPEKAPFPFNEFEWYHILNPGKREAAIQMHRYHEDGSHDVRHYTVGAERVLMIEDFEPKPPPFTDSFGIRFVSTERVCIESERFIYGLHGIEEWGANLHCTRQGLPGPLEWNEEDVGN
jgi:hypothetical protein